MADQGTPDEAGTAGSAPVAAAMVTGLLDDAAAFPPASLPLARALSEHRRHRSAWYRDLVGPLLVPAAAAAEVEGLLGQEAAGPDAALAVSVVADRRADDPLGQALAARDALAADPRVEVVAVEAPAREPAGDLARLADVADTAWLELPPSDLAALEALTAGTARDGSTAVRGAKLRMGGTAPVPPSAEVGAFLREAALAGVPVKLTAGLHHAVRTAPAPGGEHGLLNCLLAVLVAQEGAPVGQVVAALEATEREAVARAVRSATPAEAAAARRTLSSVGCCGVADPVGELVALGLLREAA